MLRKTKSGKWHDQVTMGKTPDGKTIRVSVTEDLKEVAEYKIAQLKRQRRQNMKAEKAAGMTVGKCLDKYIALSSATLSPTTIHGYKKIRKTSFQSLMDVPVSKLSNHIMQEAVNEECMRPARNGSPLSPKTIQNNYGFIATAIKEISGFTFSVKLPKTIRSIKEYPNPAEVISRIKGTDVELPCMLSIWLSFTMSEIRGLMCDSVRDGVIYIESVVVDGEKKNTRKATAKTDTRRRKHVLPPYLAELINTTKTYQTFLETGENQPLIAMNRSMIYKHFKKYTEGLDITFHDLRHLNASVMVALRIPNKYAQERGGWSTSHILENVYQHTFSDERRAVDDQVDAYFLSLIQKL